MLQNLSMHNCTYILKAKKFAEPLFQSKKIAEKVRKSGRHFWAIWGNFGPFWVIFGPFWIILGHSRAILGHLGSYLGHFGPFWVIFGHFWAILWHFWTNLRKVQIFFAGFSILLSSLLECMTKTPPTPLKIDIWYTKSVFYREFSAKRGQICHKNSDL